MRSDVHPTPQTTTIYEDIKCDIRDLANDLSIGNRIETMATKEAFVTIKDHKDNFEVNSTYRLINPAKSDLPIA